ncbi:MAG: phytanoyl-CoA dioxygenase family protein [Hyphomonas sp.]|jgi:ectoine hydroxylase-related dioxygenase (phytanoyl-CoA dioxygenase family)|nr:phytanoyl-CoA dioxygenase family protein [Henriciella sp.]MBO6695944.1 phytanoyl-CoA dioxygenase family protein [Henriciella sp.]MCH9752357.1 phytanoyl-CoA dioxygenase family protein [Alphaproteobacteria bacterium]MCR9225434.1 phytanoyl-CoA dioxygenase family protein [Hyphomonas sp.]
MPLKYLPASAAPEALADALKTDGACIVEGLLSSQDLTRMKQECMPFIDATDMGRDDFTGRKTTRTGALVARSAACRDAVMNPAIVNGAKTFLAPYCETIQLHLTQFIRIKPGQEVQPLHRDRLAWGGYLLPTLEPQFNTIWAITDFTKENGATNVIPGSNTWDPERKPSRDEVEYAEMEAGSALVYSGSVVHSGGANVSDADRIGLNITYALGWLRQEENQYLSCPPEIAKDFDPELQAMLGYAMGSYALGYFTPPLPPGQGPEVVPPDFLFNGKVASWGDEMYEKVSARAQDGAV